MKYIDEVFEAFRDRYKGLSIKLRYDKQLVSELIDATSFLPEDASLSERVWYYKEGLHEVQMCPYCNEHRRKFYKVDKGLQATCGSDQCRKAGMSKGAKAERDWDAIQAKMRATYKERTGYEHNMQNPEFIAKAKEEFAKKHNGIVCGVQTEKAKANLSKAFDEDLRKRIEQAGCTLSKIEDNIVYLKCNDCRKEISLERNVVNYRCRLGYPLCEDCHQFEYPSRSIFEKNIASVIKEIVSDVQTNKRIGKYEFDIMIPSKHLAIECNGVYWHSELYKGKMYHYDKKIVAESNGLSLVQIWEDEWNNPSQREIIISRLKSKLGLARKVYARECKVDYDVHLAEAKRFLNENHLYGSTQSAEIAIGLLYDNEIVMLATFGKPRKLMSKKSESSYELLRLCTKKGMTVVGGFSKIMKHFGMSHNESVYSYVDLCWSDIDNKGYKNAGFAYDSYTGPTYYWMISGKRYNRLQFTKDRLAKLGYDPKKSESEIMHEDMKALKVYGPGNLKMVWNAQ